MRQLSAIVMALFVFGLFASPSANAHKVFKEELETKYKAQKLKVKSCYLCHVKGKKKTSRNDFGKLFAEHEALKGEEFSARHKKLHDEEDEVGEEKLKVEMRAAFKTALADIEKTASKKGGPTYGDLIKEMKMDYLEQREDDQ